MGMNRAYPIAPTPVVPPLYQPSNSPSSDSNRNSPARPEGNSPSPPFVKHQKSFSLGSINHSLPTYTQQNEKLPSILKNKGNHSSSRTKKGVVDLNGGIYNDDMNLTYEETDDYERGSVSRSQYELYRGQDSVEDDFQPNIPGAVIENCNHSTQIFVKVLSQQPHGSSQRICNIKEDRHGGVTIYMSKPQKELDNINEDNYQQLKRQKDSQNLHNHPPEPPKIIPRKSKRKLKTKKTYNVGSSPPREQDNQHTSGTSNMNATLPSVEESQLNSQNYEPELNRSDNRNRDESPVVLSGEGEIRLDSSKVVYKDSELPLSVNNKEIITGRFSSVGVQVSPSPQYRLRFLPICGCTTFESSEQKLCSIQRMRFFLRLAGRWMFSQCGLGVILFIWALLGAAAFRATEGPQEEAVARELMVKQKELVIELAKDLRIVKKEEPGWKNKIECYVIKHKELLLEAVSEGYGEGGSNGKIWSYAGCLLFAVSLLTTLGFGAPVPRTTMGRISAVIFSAIGIPLHLLLVLNIGMLVAVKLQSLANRWQPGTSFPAALFQCCCQYKVKKIASPVHRDMHATEDQISSIDTNNVRHSKTSMNPSLSPPRWLKWFPAASIFLYYLCGVLIFGVGRAQPFAACLLFPLDFTAAGGVGLTSGTIRTFYAIYLEGAVTLAAISVSILQVSASRGLTDLGLKLGLLTNS
ncbi:uncharacterized protein [Periplaneta americana]|uniref:uncharacterized protein isoform X1 n=1 Tax=Periplaneta americana TaxID=6978 RepID=UPI0037E86A1A